MSSALGRAIWKFLVELQMCSILNDSAIALPEVYPTDRLVSMPSDSAQNYCCNIVPSSERTQPMAPGRLVVTVHPCIRIMHNVKKMTCWLPWRKDTKFPLFILVEILTVCYS